MNTFPPSSPASAREPDGLAFSLSPWYQGTSTGQSERASLDDHSGWLGNSIFFLPSLQDALQSEKAGPPPFPLFFLSRWFETKGSGERPGRGRTPMSFPFFPSPPSLGQGPRRGHFGRPSSKPGQVVRQSSEGKGGFFSVAAATRLGR